MNFQAKEKRDARAEKMRLFFFYIVMFFMSWKPIASLYLPAS